MGETFRKTIQPREVEAIAKRLVETAKVIVNASSK